MVRTIEGGLDAAENARFAIAVSRFNATITQPLLAGARDALARHGVLDVDVVWCPGAYELPQVVRVLAMSGQYAAIIALGAVVRGETYHFEVISNAAVNGLQNVAMQTGMPVSLGVLTTETIEQAQARSVADNNKGTEAALAALEMAGLWHELEHLKTRSNAPDA